MNKLAIVSVITATLSFNAASAFADDQNGITIGVGASITQGVGLDVGYDLTDSVLLRGSYYRFDFDESEEIDGIDFDVDLELENAGLYLDYHPFSNKHSGFRLTAGAVSNGNALSAVGRPSAGTYDIDGTTYTTAEVGTLDAKVDFNDIAPYLGIGYDLNVAGGISLVADLGVVFQGSPDVTYTANGTLVADPSFQADLAAEQASAEKDLEDFQYLPVAKLGIQYRF